MPGLLVEPRRPSAVRAHPWAPWFAVGAVCLGAFMGQLDAGIVTLAFPALGREFHAGPAAVEWVSLAYLLTLVGLLTAAGHLSDMLGRKLVYLHGFVVFTAASAACGLAPTLWLLILFRVVQAAGAAMLQANSVALVVTSTPPGKTRAALGLQAAAQALGLAFGPALGGLLVGAVGWRWVFWINVPVGVLAVIAGRLLLPRTRERSPRGRLDLPGLVLQAAAATALLVAISGASGLGLPTWASAALLVLAVAGGLTFWRRGPRMSSAGLAGALCGYLVLFGPLALFPQVIEHAGLGAALTALPAGFGLAALGAERVLPRRWGNGVRCAAGALTAAAALGGLALVPAEIGAVAPLLGLLGLGLGVFIPANNTAVMAGIPHSAAAGAGGLVSMVRGLGTALGVALVTLALHVADTQAALVVLLGAALLGALTARARG
jgi:MFS family permease